MYKVWKEKWLEALRSGKYKQGKNHLQDNDNNFCCLGVLCDIYDPSKWEKIFNVADAYTYNRESSSILPENIAYILGIGRFGYYVEEGTLFSLTELNDQGSTFSEIADVIEKHF